MEDPKATLLALKQALRQDLANARKSASTVDLDAPIGRLSRMDALQQQKMAEAANRRLELRLQQIESALSRVATDDYGYCVSCDEEIEARRLQARPETPLCLTCQSARERSR